MKLEYLPREVRQRVLYAAIPAHSQDTGSEVRVDCVEGRFSRRRPLSSPPPRWRPIAPHAGPQLWEPAGEEARDVGARGHGAGRDEEALVAGVGREARLNSRKGEILGKACKMGAGAETETVWWQS